MRTVLVAICSFILLGCDQQSVDTTPLPVLEVVAETAPTVSMSKPVWSIKKSDSKGVSVLHWKATITNVDSRDATDLLISALGDQDKVISSDMVRVSLKSGETKPFEGDIDIVDEDVFKIKRMLAFLIFLEH
jgi:hypothetical protein